MKIKEENIKFIINSISTDIHPIDLIEFTNLCIAEGVWCEFYLHYPIFKDMIDLHNSHYIEVGC